MEIGDCRVFWPYPVRRRAVQINLEGRVWERTVKDQYDAPPHYASIMSMSTWKPPSQLLPRMRRQRCKSHLALSGSPAIRKEFPIDDNRTTRSFSLVKSVDSINLRLGDDAPIETRRRRFPRFLCRVLRIGFGRNDIVKRTPVKFPKRPVISQK